MNLRSWLYLCSALSAVAIIVVGVVVATISHGVYYATTDVYFFGSTKADNTLRAANTLRNDQQPYVDFAAVIERQLNGNRPMAALSSTTATLYGAGVRQGYGVTLLNSGGQWQSSFADPVLRVEVVQPTAEATQKGMATILAKIQTVTVDTQRTVGAPPKTFVQATPNPSEPVISYIPARRTRALVASGLLAALVLFLNKGIADRVSKRLGDGHPPSDHTGSVGGSHPASATRQ